MSRFDAAVIFGPSEKTPEPQRSFVKVVVESLKEFDGQEITPGLVEKVNIKIISMHRIGYELI